jgi:DNA-binding transcriptional ArsR family regulator
VEFNRIVHQPARLAIMTNLFVVDSANATFLLRQTGLTWGNLGSHLTKLEEAGYIEIAKGYKGKQPETTIALSATGREALIEYRRRVLAALEPVGE